MRIKCPTNYKIAKLYVDAGKNTETKEDPLVVGFREQPFVTQWRDAKREIQVLRSTLTSKMKNGVKVENGTY